MVGGGGGGGGGRGVCLLPRRARKFLGHSLSMPETGTISCTRHMWYRRRGGGGGGPDPPPPASALAADRFYPDTSIPFIFKLRHTSHLIIMRLT